MRGRVLGLVLLAVLCLTVGAGSAGATNWGIATGSICDPMTQKGYLGPCNGDLLDQGYGASSAFQSLIGGSTPIGQHVYLVRLMMAWDAAGTNSWSGATSEGCVKAGDLTVNTQSVLANIMAAHRAQTSDGANVLIALTPDNSYDGLSADSYDPGVDGSSYPGYRGLAPNNPGSMGNGQQTSPLNEYCAVYELLSDLQQWGVDTSRVAIEAFNEPDHGTETPYYAAADWWYANTAASNWNVWTLAGTFSTGGASGDSNRSYISSYLQNMHDYFGTPAHWSFHDYHDIAAQDSQNTGFPEVDAFKTWLSDPVQHRWNFPTTSIWITEAGLNKYAPYQTVDVCDSTVQQGQARAWLSLFRSNAVQRLFWYDWSYDTAHSAIGGLFNVDGSSCGGVGPQQTMQSYLTLDSQG